MWKLYLAYVPWARRRTGWRFLWVKDLNTQFTIPIIRPKQFCCLSTDLLSICCLKSQHLLKWRRFVGVLGMWVVFIQTSGCLSWGRYYDAICIHTAERIKLLHCCFKHHLAHWKGWWKTDERLAAATMVMTTSGQIKNTKQTCRHTALTYNSNRKTPKQRICQLTASDRQIWISVGFHCISHLILLSCCNLKVYCKYVLTILGHEWCDWTTACAFLGSPLTAESPRSGLGCFCNKQLSKCPWAIGGFFTLTQRTVLLLTSDLSRRRQVMREFPRGGQKSHTTAATTNQTPCLLWSPARAATVLMIKQTSVHCQEYSSDSLVFLAPYVGQGGTISLTKIPVFTIFGCHQGGCEVGRGPKAAEGYSTDRCPVFWPHQTSPGASRQQTAARLPLICAWVNQKHMAPHNGSSVVLRGRAGLWGLRTHQHTQPRWR